MTAKAETVFAQGVNKHLPLEVYAEKMNNPYRGGTPDFYYEGTSTNAWAEYKFIELPKREDTLIVPSLTPLQKRWLRRSHANGVPTFVVVGSAAGGVVLRTPGVWEHGISAGSFVESKLSRKEIANFIYDLTCTASPLKL